MNIRDILSVLLMILLAVTSVLLLSSKGAGMIASLHGLTGRETSITEDKKSAKRIGWSILAIDVLAVILFVVNCLSTSVAITKYTSFAVLGAMVLIILISRGKRNE